MTYRFLSFLLFLCSLTGLAQQSFIVQSISSDGVKDELEIYQVILLKNNDTIQIVDPDFEELVIPICGEYEIEYHDILNQKWTK